MHLAPPPNDILPNPLPTNEQQKMIPVPMVLHRPLLRGLPPNPLAQMPSPVPGSVQYACCCCYFLCIVVIYYEPSVSLSRCKSCLFVLDSLASSGTHFL
ncbi:hypothetical protein Acr_21g0006180 [Actinidia rufa]|uniref:Uncharacterized protein n=1 Tax=Actinidia rufa TaxID=165716 RepID=A0A7J0GGT0_9ERIC|nr:hypothetical protein Acr_21g0006180 [Actinidia rufa]